VRAEQLSDGAGDSLSLWSEDDAWRDAEQVMDAATQRFGRGSIRPATLLPRRPETRAE
jgi:DNA polymerase-4